MSLKLFNFLSLLKRRLKRKFTLGSMLLIIILYLAGVFTMIHERSFELFDLPPTWDIGRHVESLIRSNGAGSWTSLQNYSISFRVNSKSCEGVGELRVVFLVKSAMNNFHRRDAIRKTWGYTKRFSDVSAQTVFLLGSSENRLIEAAVESESQKYRDIVQGSFIDNYYNNTYKAILGLTWAKTYCNNSKFYVFADDDYYVSAKNVMRFLHAPHYYPDFLIKPFLADDLEDFTYQENVELYAGFKFPSSRPLRQPFSKWYISLTEYPFNRYPPYITAGFYIMSKRTLFKVYYGSMYVNYFRFDDIYLSIIAKKLGIDLTHSDEIYYDYKSYSKRGYRYVIASHGYNDPEELSRVWNEQKQLGNA